MTRSEAQERVDGILGGGSKTWQEKKNLLVDLLVEVGRGMAESGNDDLE